MRLRLILLLLLLAQAVDAQGSNASAGTVTGTVHDSIAAAPLVGAIVQLVMQHQLASPGHSTMTDSLGRFTFRAVAAGEYVVGFFHDRLDALGLEPLVRRVAIRGDTAVEIRLAIPSPTTLRTAVCGAAGTGAFVVGATRDAATGAPRPGVRVTSEWIELSFGTRGIEFARPRREVPSGPAGRYAICDVPRAGTVTLLATQGPDSTGVIEVTVPDAGVMVRDLHLGSGMHGRLTGTVSAAERNQPIAGAVVEMAGGHRARTNLDGEWTLLDVPMGTRSIDIRAVGYSPDRVAVDVIPAAAAVRVGLITTRALLDTVRVTAHRLDPDLAAFEQRRRQGVGRYFTPEDVDRWKPLQTSTLFNLVPGLRVDRTTLGDEVVTMRALVGDRCVPAVFVDGQYMRDLTADDINSWVRPAEIAGMEIYSATSVPGEFMMGMRDGCGAIVIWTRTAPGPVVAGSWKHRLLRAAAILAVAALLGRLLD